MAELLLVGLDTETTGVDPQTAELLQLGAVSMHERTRAVTVLMNAQCRPSSGVIPEEASAIHGITMETVALKPYDIVAGWQLSLILGSLLRTSKHVALVTYNGEGYDLPVLKRHKVDVDMPHIDVYRIVQRELHQHGLKLGEVYESYTGNKLVEAHDAIPDVLATLEILDKYMDESGKSAEEIVKWLAEPQVLEICYFGKHKGRPFSEIPFGYLRFCQEKFDNISPDLQATFDHYLGKRK